MVFQSPRPFDRLRRLLSFGKDLNTENAKFAENVGESRLPLRGLSDLRVKVSFWTTNPVRNRPQVIETLEIPSI
jgi:hypothetical protein